MRINERKTYTSNLIKSYKRLVVKLTKLTAAVAYDGHSPCSSLNYNF